MKPYPQLSIRKPKLVLMIWGCVLMAMGVLIVFVPQLKINPTFKSMIMTNDPDRAFDQEAKDTFGDDELIVVAIENPSGVIQIATLQQIDRLTRAIQDVPGVREVYSLTNSDNIRGSGGTLLTDDLITELPHTQEELDRVARDLDDNPLFTGTIISKDRKVAGINIEIAPSHADPKHQAEITKAIFKIVDAEEKASGTRIHVTGLPVSSYLGGTYMIHDMVLFGALSCVLLFVVIWVALRRFQAILFAMIVAMCGVAVAYGSMSLLGVSVTMPLSAVMVFLMAIGMEYAIHVGFSYNQQTLHERHQGHKIRDKRFVLSEGVRGIRGAVIFSAVATTVGFLSMLSNPVPDLAKMGLFLCIGSAALLFAAMTLVPAIIALWPYEVGPAQETPRLDQFISRLTESAIKRPILHVVIMLGIIGVSVLGWTMLSSDTDAMQYFKKGSRVRQDEEFVRKYMNGTTYLQAVVVGPAVDTFKEPGNLQKLDTIRAYAETLPHVTKVVTHADHIKLMNKALHDGKADEYRLPDSRAAVEQYLLLHNEPDDFRLFIDSDYRRASIMLRMDTMSSTILKDVEHKIEGKMAEAFGPQFEGNVVGTTLLVHRAFDEMADAMAQGLAIALALAFGITFLFLRSVKLSLVSLLPNIIPIGMNYAFLGFIGHPIDPPAAVTGAIALGLSVDDTSHMFWTWLRARKQMGYDAVEAVRLTMREVGPPTFLKNIVVAFGFSVIMFSQYGTLVWMGIMLAVVTITGLAWDLLVTPALLRLSNVSVRTPKQSEMKAVVQLNKTTIDPKRPRLDDYSDDEIKYMMIYDFFATAGKTIIRQGGRYGTRRLLYELELTPGMKVLEFGAGIGGNAFALIETYKVSVVGVDISAYMVEKGEERAKALGIADVCQFVLSKEDRLPFDDNTFDVVMAEAVLMYTDVNKTIPEIFRVLKPGGKLGFHDWSWTIKPEKDMEDLTCVIACGCNVGDVAFFQHKDWEQHFKRRGFQIGYSQEYPFDFFTWHGMVDDEGTWNVMKMFGRIMKRRAAATRCMSLMAWLLKYEGSFGYVIMTATKPLDAADRPATKQLRGPEPAEPNVETKDV